MFHFIRIDGGRIESLKAERTWWGRGFSPEEKEVLTNVYGKYSDKIIAKLKEAGFNWIWVTWSNGWSMKEEEENRRQLTEFIARCHEQGIKVTAYLSATNIFWENTFIYEPESVTWLWIVNGKPVNYGGNSNPLRFIADARIPAWREYILKKAKLAIEAGADAIFYDNIIGENSGNRLLLSETQRMAEKYAAETKRPKILLYANVHMDPDRLDMNDECELLWDEEGKDTPGARATGWLTDNVRKIKFLNAAKQPWQPLKYEYDLYNCGPRETCIPDPDEQKLTIAEEYSFGAGLSRNIEGRFLKALLTDEKEALDSWAAIAHYNNFISANSSLYNRATPLARIAILSETYNNNLADVFIKRNIMFSMKVLGRLDKGLPLSNYSVLVIPFAPDKYTPGDEKALRDFAAAGGKIFAAPPGSSRKWDKQDSKKDRDAVAAMYKDLGAAAIPQATLSKIEQGGDISDFIQQLISASGGPVITLENSKYVLANVTKKDTADTFIIHLVNYDQKTPAENVKVNLDLNGYVKDLKGYTLRLLSPDSLDTKPENTKTDGTKIEFSVAKIKHYTIAIITK